MPPGHESTVLVHGSDLAGASFSVGSAPADLLVQCGDTAAVRCPPLPAGIHLLKATKGDSEATHVVIAGSFEGLSCLLMIGCLAQTLDDALGVGLLDGGEHQSLKAKLTAAALKAQAGEFPVAIQQMEAFLHRLETLRDTTQQEALAESLRSVTRAAVIPCLQIEAGGFPCHIPFRVLGEKIKICEINDFLQPTQRPTEKDFNLEAFPEFEGKNTMECRVSLPPGDIAMKAAVRGPVTNSAGVVGENGALKTLALLDVPWEDLCCHRYSARNHATIEALLGIHDLGKMQMGSVVIASVFTASTEARVDWQDCEGNTLSRRRVVLISLELTCERDIELNPVKCTIVGKIVRQKFSSFNGQAQDDPPEETPLSAPAELLTKGNFEKRINPDTFALLEFDEKFLPHVSISRKSSGTVGAFSGNDDDKTSARVALSARAKEFRLRDEDEKIEP